MRQFAGAHAPERCPTEVKRRIARQLQEYGVFELKGQVSEVAKGWEFPKNHLPVSEGSLNFLHEIEYFSHFSPELSHHIL